MKIRKTYFHVQAWAGQVLGSNVFDKKETPPLLRRRISPMGKEALSLASVLPLLDSSRFIFSSRHGEFSRTLSILKQIAEKDPLSPVDFSLSVHHALISLLSIACKNHKGHVAVSGGLESFGLGLIEALACLDENPNEPVMLLYCDDFLPDEYAVFNEDGFNPIVLAVLLGGDEGQKYSVDVSPSINNDVSNSLAYDFLSFLQGKKTVTSTQTAKHLWRWKSYASF